MCINMLLVYYLHLLKVCMVNSPSVVHGISSRKSSYNLQCMMQFYCTSCNAMPPNGMETQVHHTTSPVDCQIEFLSFKRLGRARIWLYPLHDQTTRK